ncbi:hypothetical protein [Methanofollis ethanolicus]|uniref:hypothetical protein n=1 Tax=Methanofollis ethanolicus TaxID=488124 RepID=UPI0008334FE5|nr:hypothetical protein [Methanofollis ethanolicus]
MDKVPVLILVAGVVIGLVLAVAENIFMGVSIFVVLLTVAMCLQIMTETKNLPAVTCQLSDDAKSVVVVNGGNAPAEAIHIALVPMNLEFDVTGLGVDAEYAYALPAMAEEIKAVVTYKNNEGREFGRSFKLSSLEENDPLRPAFPMFSWK